MCQSTRVLALLEGPTVVSYPCSILWGSRSMFLVVDHQHWESDTW